MNCPQCKTALVARKYEAGIEVDECLGCRGMWLDKGELERIEETVENDYSEQLKRPDNTVQRSFEMAKQKGRPDLPCPKCNRQMNKKECHYGSAVMVDVCTDCGGLWLDGGEIRSLETFAERARSEERAELKKEQEKQQRGFFGKLRGLFGG